MRKNIILLSFLLLFLISLSGHVLAQSPTCTPNPLGDANNDGKTSLIDFEFWRIRDPKADFNCQNNVDNEDFFVWKENYLPLTLTVCPTGTQGQNGCDFIGETGLRNAINNISPGTPENKSIVRIKQGVYYPSSTVNCSLIFPDGNERNLTCYYCIKGKNIILEGEGVVVINGSLGGSGIGFCSDDSNIEINNLEISGFKYEGIELRGNGIFFPLYESKSCVIKNSRIINNGRIGLAFPSKSKNILITNNIIKENYLSGIFLSYEAEAKIKNNILLKNEHNGIYQITTNSNNKTEIINNTLYDNGKEGDDAQIYFDNNPSAIVKNNLIIGGKNYGIFFNSHGSSGVSFSYNNIWNNTRRNYFGTNDPTGNNGNISINPLFIDLQNNNFHLNSNSPAKNTGDPSILNPDGSRSDMGAYGGMGACGLDSTLPGCQ